MNKIVFIILNVALLYSCSITSYKYIDIQVLNPSDTTLPANTSQLHIVDNCNGQKMGTAYGNLCNNNNQSVFDTTLVWFFEVSPTFKNIKTVIQHAEELKSETKKNHEQGHVMLTSFYSAKVDTSDFVKRLYSYYGNYIVSYKLKVDLSDAVTLKHYDSYIYKDSFSWPRQDAQGRMVPRKITDLLAFVEIAAAQRYTNHIATYWTTEERMFYYNSGTLMQIGYNRFNENDLEGAISYWEKAFDTGNTKIKALAAYDIGLAFEMLDNLDECEQWLLKSKEIKKYPPVYNYLKIIKERKEDHAILDKMLK